MADSVIMLVDMNAFFASVEQQCNPFLQGKPVLVGGARSTRSVAAAVSYEARPYGIHSGMPISEAMERCPHAVAVEGNLKKYIDVAHRIFRICGDYTDKLEIYSIDECFLDVTATKDLFGGADKIALAIKKRIRSEMGLTCSIGIAPNKMLAKLAANMRKPDGLYEIKRENVKDLLENLPVEELHGIGERLKISLARLGITTAGELGRASKDRLKKEFGVMGEVFHKMGNGIYNPPVVAYNLQPDAKSVGHSYTLDKNTRDMTIIKSHLLRLSEMVGRRMREQNYSGRTVNLYLRFSDMHGFMQQKSISEYIDDGFDIYKYALLILEKKLKSDKRPVRLVGVSMSNLAKGIRQLNLFATEKMRAALKVMDEINNRFGEFSIKRASLIHLNIEKKTHGFEGKDFRD
ncbi:MAG: DNA polymerase IV [Armatimonadota bacterium]